MIYGIGNDLVALKRIENLYQKYGQNLANHVLHPIEQEELAQANNQANFIAKRFAAKEAFAKAVGTGLHSPVTLRNIGVGHHESGKPEFFYEPVLVLIFLANSLKSSKCFDATENTISQFKS